MSRHCIVVAFSGLSFIIFFSGWMGDLLTGWLDTRLPERGRNTGSKSE